MDIPASSIPASTTKDDSLRHSFMQCANCMTSRADGTRLKVCSKCQVVKYCSRECQKTHWSQHKVRCETNQKRALALAALSEDSDSLASSGGVPLAEMLHILRGWADHHRAALIWGMVRAVMSASGGKPKRADFRDNWFVVKVAFEPEASRTKRRFSIVDFTIFPGEKFNQLGADLEGIRKKNLEDNAPGNEPRVVGFGTIVVLGPIMYTFNFGISPVRLKDQMEERLPLGVTWRQLLKEAVNEEKWHLVDSD